MIGVPGLTKAASDISKVPAAHRPRAAQLHAAPRAEAFRLHNMAAMALNQTSTDRSTCTTSATRGPAIAWLAVVAFFFFWLQTMVLDALVWPHYY